MLKAGIVGLPNVGKSTLFNALTRSRKAEAANYPFCTIDPNVGVVIVPDQRLEVLARSRRPKSIPAAIEFVDIAGLVKGASKGEGLGNQFLSHIREVDAIVQVVRCFEDTDIHHVRRDRSGARHRGHHTELVLADLEPSPNARQAQKKAKAPATRRRRPNSRCCDKLIPHLNSGKPANTLATDTDDKAAAKASSSSAASR